MNSHVAFQSETRSDGVRTVLVITSEFGFDANRCTLHLHEYHGNPPTRIKILTASGWIERDYDPIADFHDEHEDEGIPVAGAFLALLQDLRQARTPELDRAQAELESYKQLAEASARTLEVVTAAATINPRDLH